MEAGRRTWAVLAAFFVTGALVAWWLTRTSETAAPAATAIPRADVTPAAHLEPLEPTAPLPPRVEPRSRADRPAPDEPNAATPDIEEFRRRLGAIDARSSSRCAVRVVLADGGAPVAGASVRIDSRERRKPKNLENLTTGADGRVDFDRMRTILGAMTVEKTGFQVVRRDLTTMDQELVVRLETGVVVRGRVIHVDSRRPIAGAQLRAWRRQTSGMNDDDEVGTLVTTDADGRFEFAPLPPAVDVVLYATAKGLGCATKTVTQSAPTKELEFVLGEGGVLDGTVFDAGDRPSPGVTVHLVSNAFELELTTRFPAFGVTRSEQERFVARSVTSDEAGRFEFCGVPLSSEGADERRVAVARDSSGRTAAGDPAVFGRHGERQTRDLRFATSTSLTVRVERGAGPRNALQVEVDRMLGSRSSQTLEPAETSITFRDLVEGLYLVGVTEGERFRRGRYASKRLRLREGEAAEAALRLEWPLRLAGVVVDARGSALPGVELRWDATDRASSIDLDVFVVSAKDGSFVFEGLPDALGRLDAEIEERTFAPVRMERVDPRSGPVRVVMPLGTRVMGVIDVAPTSGRSVSAWVSTRDPHAIVDLDLADDGKFTAFLPISGRAAELWFEVDGLAPVVRDVPAVTAGSAWQAGTIRFERGLTFEGTIRDADGAPLSGAVLGFDGARRNDFPKTDATGSFRLERLERRPVRLLVEGTETRAPWLLVFDPASGPRTFTVGAGVEIVGRVTDAKGTPLDGAGLRVEFDDRPGGNYLGFNAERTGSDGRFALRVQPGRHGVSVFLEGGHAALEPAVIDVVDGPNAPFELRVR